MAFTQCERAIYLFCAPLSQTRTTPLTVAEWHIVREMLEEHRAQPKQLLTSTLTLPERIAQKITARQQLGLALYELESAIHKGYRIMFDYEMPRRILRVPRNARPPYLYYVGDLSLCAMPSLLAVFQTELLARLEPHTIITPYYDEHVASYLQRGGRVIITADEGLNFWTRQHQIRRFVKQGQLLITTLQPVSTTGQSTTDYFTLCQWLADAVLISDTPLDGELFEHVVANCEHQWSTIYVTGTGEAVKVLTQTAQATPFTTMDAVRKGHCTNEPARFAELVQLFTPAALPAWQTALHDALAQASEHVSKEELHSIIHTYLAQH